MCIRVGTEQMSTAARDPVPGVIWVSARNGWAGVGPVIYAEQNDENPPRMGRINQNPVRQRDADGRSDRAMPSYFRYAEGGTMGFRAASGAWD